MSNVEADPVAVRCGAPVETEGSEEARVEVLTARDVPLGGVRAMQVRRTLPQRARTLIGAWCFADHYGPVDVPARRHARPAAPPHRTADRELAVHRRARAPRQPRHPRPDPARRTQPHDRRPRHLPLRSLHTGDTGCTGSSSGWPCPMRTATLTATSTTTSRPCASTGPRPGCSSASSPEAPPRSRRSRRCSAPNSPRTGRRLTWTSTPASSTACSSTPETSGWTTALRPANSATPRGVATLTLVNPPMARPHDPARRAAVRRADRHVVELRRALPRRNRAGQRGLAARVRPVRASTAIRGTASPRPALPNAVITPRGEPAAPQRESRSSVERDRHPRSCSEVDEKVTVRDPGGQGARAGLTAYRDRGDQRVFHHTEVDDAYAGSGPGRAAGPSGRSSGGARNREMRIVPVCPYVAKFLKRHQEFADITDPVTPEILQWLDTGA